MSLFTDVLIIILLFIFFGISHTILASLKVKQSIKEKLGDKIAFYRAFYNIISIITFLVVFDLSPKSDVVIYDLPNPWDIVFLAVQVLGLACLIWSFKLTDGLEFLGIKQIIRYMKGSYDVNDLDENYLFKIEGPYKFSRHPIYFFSIVILTFQPAMSLWYLILLICVILYFIIGSYYEERKLVKLFGVRYIEYQKNVARIIPYKFF